MNFQQDLEEYKRTCLMMGKWIQDSSASSSKEIIINEDDLRRYKSGEISVKELDAEAEMEMDRGLGVTSENQTNHGLPDSLSVIIRVEDDSPPKKPRALTVADVDEVTETKDVKSTNQITKNNNPWKSSNSATRKFSKEFTKEDDIPDLNDTKVYDYVMSRNKTLQANKLAEQLAKRFTRKWICIGSLVLSTVLLIVIVAVVLILTSTSTNAINKYQ